MDDVRVYVGSDHAGFGLRKSLIDRLRSQGRRVVDLGPDTDAACDYPEFAYAVASAVRNDPGSLGILACATGQGMAIAAGKVRGIRAVVPATVEAARLTRFDNNANILCIGSRLLAERDAFAIVDTWLATGFAGGRHARRIAKVAAIETATAIVFVTESERLRLKSLGVPGRIFEQDPALFAARPKSHAASKQSLGWIALPGQMLARWSELGGFVACDSPAGAQGFGARGRGSGNLRPPRPWRACAAALACAFTSWVPAARPARSRARRLWASDCAAGRASFSWFPAPATVPTSRSRRRSCGPSSWPPAPETPSGRARTSPPSRARTDTCARSPASISIASIFSTILPWTRAALCSATAASCPRRCSGSTRKSCSSAPWRWSRAAARTASRRIPA